MNLDFARSVLKQEAQAILKIADSLGDAFETAVGWILESKGRVVTCGVGKSGHIARKTAGTLSSTGTPSFFLHASEAIHGDLGNIRSGDLVLMYTHSGETDELVRLFPSVYAIGARTILVTGRPESSAGRLANLVLCTHVEDEACPNNLAPTTSTTAMLALSDALALEVMERRGFTKEDYARFHPGGTLGRRLLLSVADVMRKDADLAIVHRETSIVEVMRTITNAGAGAACVVQGERQIVGLITEGDLRRHFLNSNNPVDATAEAIMTRDFTSIAPDLLAVEALEFFQNLPMKIGEMPVVRDGEVLGLLMLKDLLRSGIV